jgi:hypothetical protein
VGVVLTLLNSGFRPVFPHHRAGFFRRPLGEAVPKNRESGEPRRSYYVTLAMTDTRKFFKIFSTGQVSIFMGVGSSWLRATGHVLRPRYDDLKSSAQGVLGLTTGHAWAGAVWIVM